MIMSRIPGSRGLPLASQRSVTILCLELLDCVHRRVPSSWSCRDTDPPLVSPAAGPLLVEARTFKPRPFPGVGARLITGSAR